MEAFGKNHGIMHIFFWNLREETEHQGSHVRKETSPD
jgi:hypothetical protein